MPRRRRLALALTAAALGASACTAAAGAASAPAYQARLNGLCRTYTPTLKKLEADAATAKRAGNVQRVYYDLGYALALGLREDRAIEAIPVPAALRAQMTPILSVFKRVDAHAEAFIKDAQTNKVTAALAELKAIDSLSKPMNGQLDRAGLPDCGSRQS